MIKNNITNSMCSNGRKLFLKNERVFNYWSIFIFKRENSSHYINTLHLPQTTFPHKIKSVNRRERDCMIEAAAKFEELYDWQRKHNVKQEYILHDGPPYANGDVHIGHAVNKILKDITVRQKLLKGCKIHFKPGWDCHGLPIELKVLKENHEKDFVYDSLGIRKKAFEFSQSTKEKQLQSFRKWGILADWENSYFTCSQDYIIQQLNIFQDLFDKGIIYRDYKPVFWSPVNRTSLAEAELEYNSNHISPSIYVKFIINKCPDVLKSKLGHNSRLSLIVWTTTPWTLPANQAVCFSPDEIYSIVSCGNKNEFYIIAHERISAFTNTLKCDLYNVFTFEGNLLQEVKYLHPFLKNKECPLLSAHHVTMTKGTGLVHMAPNHGFDDYIVAKRHKFPLDICLVDENGCYTLDAGEELHGKDVLNLGTKSVLELIQNDILAIEDYVHSYPYDWRSKTPVLVRSSHQWFIDVHQIQEQVMQCLKNVVIIPDHLKTAFFNQLSSAPQWCISRQRAWGVAIPAFYSRGKSTPIVDRALTENLCRLIKKYGIHCWWEMELDQLFPLHLKEKMALQNVDCVKGSDILDIWLDSGTSWKSVLPDPYVSDICIEGIDQIRGWFNSSLLTSVALRGEAPYRALFLHGFTTDADGRKMSKSEGNVIDPLDILCGSEDGSIPPYGIDVLRWWVASHACQYENIAVKLKIIDECSQNLNKIRNTFKFILGSLHEFNPLQDIIIPQEMRSLDIYLLHKLLQFSQKLQKEYNELQYKNVAKYILNFVTNEISSFYLQLIKDRLYCSSRDSSDRLSCQTVLYFILNILVHSIGPICPHLAEEVILHHPYKDIAKLGLFRCHLPCLDTFLNDIALPTSIGLANQIRNCILKTELKTNSLHVLILCDNEVSNTLQSLNHNTTDNSGLTEFFQASEVTFGNQSQSFPEDSIILNEYINGIGNVVSQPCTIILSKSNLQRCPRCWRYSTVIQSVLCNRCLHVLTAAKEQTFL